MVKVKIDFKASIVFLTYSAFSFLNLHASFDILKNVSTSLLIYDRMGIELILIPKD